MYLSYRQPWRSSRDEKPAVSLWCYRLHMATRTAELPGSTFPLGSAILLFLLLLWMLLIIFYQQVASCRAPRLGTGSCSCTAGWELPFCFEANELVPPNSFHPPPYREQTLCPGSGLWPPSGFASLCAIHCTQRFLSLPRRGFSYLCP